MTINAQEDTFFFENVYFINVSFAHLCFSSVKRLLCNVVCFFVNDVIHTDVTRSPSLFLPFCGYFTQLKLQIWSCK